MSNVNDFVQEAEKSEDAINLALLSRRIKCKKKQ